MAIGVDTGPVERVAGYDLDVFWEVPFEGFNLGGFTRCLAAYDGAEFGS